MRVFLAASSASGRRGLVSLLGPEWEVAGVGTLRDSVPTDVDLVLAELEGGELVSPAAGPPWIVLVDDPEPAWLADALRGNLRGLLPRDALESEVLAALEAVGNGLFCCHPEHLARLVPGAGGGLGPRGDGPVPTDTPRRPPQGGALPDTPRRPPQGGALTSREREILMRLAAGLGNKQIASQLAISEHTVKFHLGSIYSKLDANTRAEAVAAGLRRGLVWI